MSTRPQASRDLESTCFILGAPRASSEPVSVPSLPAENLRALLTADLRAQRLRSSRQTVLYLLAIAGGLCWALIMGGAKSLPSLWHDVAVVGWPIGLALVIYLGLLERKWNSRLVRLTRR